jgi:hypothetical protein
MSARNGTWALLSLGIALAVAGCGSGGAANSEGGVANCQPASTGLGSMSWLDDGKPACAVTASATFTTNATLTLFSLTGATTSLGVGIGIESTTEGPVPIGGSYACGADDGGIEGTFSYTQGLGTNTFSQSCQISVNMQGTPGLHAMGMFSATLMPAAGGTKSITDGVFDAPVTIVDTN